MSPPDHPQRLPAEALIHARRVAASITAMLPEAGVVVVDTDWHVVLLEGEIFARHGQRPEQLVGRHVSESVDAESWEHALGHWTSALAGATRSADWALRGAGGRDYWVHFSPVRDDDGAVVGAAMVAQDVTDRMRAQRQLERRTTQQTAVSHLGALVLEGTRLDEVLAYAANTLVVSLGADAAAVFADGEDGPRAASGDAALAAALQGPLVTGVLPAGAPPSIVSAIVGSSREGRFGCLGACRAERGAFSDEDSAFVHAIANLVAQSADQHAAAEQIAQAEGRLVDFWDLATDLLAVLDPAGCFEDVSGSWERTMGWTPDELIGRGGLEFVHPEDRATSVQDGDPAVRPEGEESEVLNRFRAKDGSYRWLLWNVRVGAAGRIYAGAKDVTERQLASEERRRAEELLDQTERLSGSGSWQIDLATGEHRISENLQALIGVDSRTITNETFLSRVHPEDRSVVQASMAAQVAGSDEGPDDFRVSLPDGTVRLMRVTSEVVRGAGRLPVALRGTVRDVTTERAAADQLAASEERFRQSFDNAPIAQKLAEPGSGRFLKVNDAFCELVGRTRDELLGLSIQDVVHPDDMHGPAADPVMPDDVDTMVFERRYLRPDGSTVWGKVHMSRIVHPDGGLDVLFGQIIDETARHAQEDALRRQLSEVSWIGEIRAALVENRFEMHAQPIVDLKSGATVHHELLLRMRDRQGELVAPDSFLPTAERYGDIRDIDRWVVAHGMELAAKGMSVGINLSAASLSDPGLIGHIDAQLQRTGADPARLIFEITETALMESADTARVLGEGLRERGCRFALDDFGTGYGGFHYLKTLPLDVLKIDREFVRDALDSESDRHLIWAVVNLARGFGLLTVAEGIEDAATMSLLREMGVDQGQGYHIGRPALPSA